VRVCVVGLGYIGLPTATLAASVGHDVVGVDTNESIVKAVNGAKPHIRGEAGLDALVRQVVERGNLVATTSMTEADVFLVAVPTPITDTKKADLNYVVGASESVAPFLRKGNLFVVESTIPPGCTRDLIIPILEKSGLKAGADFHVAHCPERVIPGNILYELVNNDRVIGGVDEESAQKAREFYATFVKGDIFTTGLTEAELTKLSENAYRDVNIAFANELALVCETLGVDVWEVVRLANRHPRVNILRPGPGVGGHCIAVDPWFLVEACPRETRLITAARAVNDDRPEHIAAMVQAELTKLNIDKATVACLGLTYKADVDDMRGSPSVAVISSLIRRGYEVRVCDPYACNESSYKCVPIHEAVAGADALVLLVDHKEYRELDLEQIGRLMRHNVIVDTRGVWNR
jgi:UDP-N-acetyl-D-mannosaminuronic acid dehydrogenase